MTEQPQQDWRPVPDPTKLTTEAVAAATTQYRRELDVLRELLSERLGAVQELLSARVSACERDGAEIVSSLHARVPDLVTERVTALRSLIEARIDGMDRAIRLHAEIIDRIPAQQEQATDHLRQLHEEKFASIGVQFAERDTRTDQDKESAKQALDAALLAQKELVAQQNEANAVAAAKAEASFTKQIDQIGTIIQTLREAMDARITELKERIDRGEGATSGSHETAASARLNLGAAVGAVGLLIAVVTLILYVTKK